MNRFRTLLAYLFSPKGRAKRIEIIIVAAILSLIILYTRALIENEGWDSQKATVLFNFLPVFAYIYLIFCIRRLHDINLSGWHLFNPISQILMVFKGSFQGTSKYG
jgi:uncharacterized membrane protein YhaH (DUF805 family)